MPPFWLKTNWWVVSHPPTHLTSLLAIFLFPGMNQDSKRRHFAEPAEVQRELLATLDSISIENFKQCFQQWEQHWDHCIQSQEEYFEGD
jgi:hypothetical protein